jgi:hypothetical protein
MKHFTLLFTVAPFCVSSGARPTSFQELTKENQDEKGPCGDVFGAAVAVLLCM